MNAAQEYALAIETAAAQNCSHLEALANELAAKFWLGKKNKKIAAVYLADAYQGYRTWGAGMKLRCMRDTYPDILAGVLPYWGQEGGRSIQIEDKTQVMALQAVELASVIKASQAISQELILDSLLERLITILVENAGATKGALFLSRNGEFSLALLAKVEGGGLVVVRPQGVGTGEQVPLSILRSVSTSMQPLVLADAASDVTYGVDPYIRRFQPRSILCTPLLLHTDAQGVIYLENTLTTYAFTRNRLETIQMLAAQAAISLQSARLFSALQMAEAKYHAIFDYSPAGIFQATPEGRLQHVNQAVADILGYISAAEIIAACTQGSQPLFVDPDMLENLLARTKSEGEVSGVEVQLLCKEGFAVWVEINAKLLRDEDDGVERIEGFINDISMRKAAEERIFELNRRLQCLQEEERLRLSRDLHDDVAQDLVSLKIGYELLRQDCPAWAETVAQRLERMSGRLQQALDKVRNLSHMLRPPDIERFGLIHSLEMLCMEMAEEQKLDIVFTVKDMKDTTLSPEAGINLYRLVQEALNNVKKHAQASRVDVLLRGAFPDILLRIKDNGKGFTPKEQQEAGSHLGLKTMRERGAQLGGRLRLDSNPGSGVEISLSFPMTGGGTLP